MSKRNLYNTKQKELITNIIKAQTQEFTVKDIYEQLKDSTGLTTIYRVIDSLVANNTLTKSIAIDNTVYYQYLGDCHLNNHFYLKCSKCGHLIHIDCDCINDIATHIMQKHKFKLARECLIINGECNNCLTKKEVS